MKKTAFLYHYKAFISAAYDGDTVTADIDLGLRTVGHTNINDQLVREGLAEYRDY
jgi:hypothetical protein